MADSDPTRATDRDADDRDYGALQGVEMDRAEIDAVLREEGVGLLSLADGGEAYAVPVSFGYDGEDRLYFLLIRFGEASRKLEFLETTDTATLAVYTVTDKDRWRSVLARGPIARVPDDRADEVESVMFDNAWSARLFPFGEPITGIVRAEMVVESVTGQKGAGYED